MILKLNLFQFQEKIVTVFPIIKKDWIVEIATPAFETNPTVIYDKFNRSWKEIEQEFYQ